MRNSGNHNSGQRWLPYRRPSSRDTDVLGGHRYESRAYPPPHAPANVSGTAPFRSENAHPGPASSTLMTQPPRHQTSPENLDTAGARWPLVDQSGVLYYVNDPVDSIEP
ncbi:hypothetical protein RRF57_000899 [Xylaria bambusicola]|uniref:Uncharacterized protein n=1 Tax=Xylaria bambusicola TaxID=326684 RepID=A0AAN7UAZ4_9PEZI